MGIQPLPKKGRPQISAHVYCSQTTAWIKMPLGTQVGLGSGDFVLDGDVLDRNDPAPPPKKGDRAPSPIFGPCLLWPNGWMDQAGTWHGGGPWSRPFCANMETQPPPQIGGGPSPQFSAHVYCGQTAEWINMALGTKVGLDPGHIVLDGDPAVPAPLSIKWDSAPSQFSENFYFGQTKRLDAS